MALDRMSIEKKDFPVGRRGYDPEAVDSHLRAIAEEVEQLRRSTTERTETLAGVASARVQAIVEAAEQSSAEIQRQAEDEARAIRDEATSDAKRERRDASADAKREREEAARDAQNERQQAASDAKREREQALQQSREYVGHVSEAASQLRNRLEAMEAELTALTETLRTGGDRLTTELEVLDAGMSDLSAVAGGRAEPRAAEPVEGAIPGAGELEPESTLEAVAPEETVSAGAVEPDLPPEPKTAAELEPDAGLEPEPEVGSEPLPLPAEAEPAELTADMQPGSSRARGDLPAEAAAGDDTEGARLIALNMALNGTPREETDRYLAANFELSDRGQLLDEVYASVEG